MMPAELKEIFERVRNEPSSERGKIVMPAVYTLYDGMWRAIYVGFSLRIWSRFYDHVHRDYWQRVRCIGVRIYSDESEARIAEMYQIALMQPLLNRDGLRESGVKVIIPKPYCSEILIDQKGREMLFTPSEMEESIIHCSNKGRDKREGEMIDGKRRYAMGERMGKIVDVFRAILASAKEYPENYVWRYVKTQEIEDAFPEVSEMKAPKELIGKAMAQVGIKQVKMRVEGKQYRFRYMPMPKG